MTSEQYELRLDELARDHVSGAREIVSRLLPLLQARLRGADGPSAQERILAAAVRIVPAQPSMAPLLYAFDRLFRNWDSPAGLANTLHDLINEHRQSLSLVVEKAVPLLGDAHRVATLSWSSTVCQVLEQVDRKLDVVVAESRPGCEGRRCAARAAAAGHAVEFHADATFPRAAAQADILLLGGDALIPSGLVNKVGSYTAAREARESGTPVVALVDRFKIIDSSLGTRLRVLPMNASEVWEGAPTSVSVRCSYFERVPLELLTQVWGEDGAREPGAVFGGEETESPSAVWTRVPEPTTGAPLA